MGSRYSRRDRRGEFEDRGRSERERYPEHTRGYGSSGSDFSGEGRGDNYFGGGRQGYGDGMPPDDFGNMGSAWRSSGSYGRMGESDRDRGSYGGGYRDSAGSYRSPSGMGRDDYRTGYSEGKGRTWDDEIRGNYGRGTNSEYSSRGSYGSSSPDWGYGPERSYGSDRGYSSDRGDRGWWDKASDEVASWFGDDEAERRRRMDESRGEHRHDFRGEHRGKGPRNYKRSDDRIKDDINDKLTDDYVLDASDVDVEVNEGDVVLTGTVKSRYEKRHAEDIAEEVSGVRNVENRIRVSDSRSSSNSDTSAYSSSYMSGSTGSTGSTGMSSTGSSDPTTGSTETGSENRTSRSAGSNS